MQSEVIVNVNNIYKYFGELKVLKGVSCNIKKGEKVVMIGPSGSGKSTFLRCLNQLETATDGQIIVDGQDVTDKHTDINKLRENIGMVFQHFNLFPHKTVLENIMLAPVELKKMTKAEARETGLKLLKRVGMADKADAYPCQLSGGQQQRIAIARALAMHPQMLFFDEPTSALDPELTTEVLKILRQLAEKKMTMVIVTHEIDFARAVSDRVIFMADGYIVEEGAPADVIDNPRNPRTQAFLRKVQR